MSDWASIAYVHSTMGIKLRDEMKRWRNKSGSSDSNYDENNNNTAFTNSNFILIGDEYTNEDIQSAFTLDWRQMKWEWLQIHLTENLETQLRRCLESYYGIICCLFIHYCGYGQGNVIWSDSHTNEWIMIVLCWIVGERYGLSLKEFEHMFHMSRVMDMNDPSKLTTIGMSTYLPSFLSHLILKPRWHQCIDFIHDKPLEGNRSQPSNMNTTNLITRIHFVQCLVAYAAMNNSGQAFIDQLDNLLTSLTQYWLSLQKHYMIYSCPDDTIRLTVSFLDVIVAIIDGIDGTFRLGNRFVITFHLQSKRLHPFPQRVPR